MKSLFVYYKNTFIYTNIRLIFVIFTKDIIRIFSTHHYNTKYLTISIIRIVVSGHKIEHTYEK